MARAVFTTLLALNRHRTEVVREQLSGEKPRVDYLLLSDDAFLLALLVESSPGLSPHQLGRLLAVK